MSVAEVAEALSRSKGWVSMRQGLLEEMTPSIQDALFRGAVPVYSYMYTLRPFMRMNAVSTGEVERFLHAVAGKRLSVPRRPCGKRSMAVVWAGRSIR